MRKKKPDDEVRDIDITFRVSKKEEKAMLKYVALRNLELVESGKAEKQIRLRSHCREYIMDKIYSYLNRQGINDTNAA